MKPRRRGYVHRPIIAVRENLGMLETGELVTDLTAFARTNGPHVWVTHDPTHLLNALLDQFGQLVKYTFTDSRDPEIELYMQTARLASFGFIDATKKVALHQVWQPTRMFAAPGIAADIIGADVDDVMRFAIDVREWCAENNLPLKATLPGIAASLLRDDRFWPDARGRVPRATNESVRKHLPGVYQERRGQTIKTYKTAIAMDQSRAYHRAAQEIDTPDPTNLYARGFYADPLSAPELWAPRGSVLYERTVRQSGVIAVIASSRPERKGEWRPPVCRDIHRRVRYLWTNELDYCERHGLQIEGIVAAWTSETPDEGLPRYGKWAEGQIDGASDYRRKWLKPTLHSLYGLLAARPRDLLIGRNYGKGEPEVYTLRGFAYPVQETTLRNQSPTTVNVPMLGVLQAEIRTRTLALADQYGDQVLHVHADGLHLLPTQLEFVPTGWTAEPVTNLQYLDDVSWISDERDVLPGRDQRQRIELRRSLVNLITQRQRRRVTTEGRGAVAQRTRA